MREKEKLLVMSNFSLFPVLSTPLESFLPSADSFSLEESKNFCLGKSYLKKKPA